MTDCISRDAAIKAIQAVPKGNWNNQRYVNEIERVPAADVVERKHGEWISVKENVLKYIWRYRNKNGVEDLKKARMYLDFMIENAEDGKSLA